MPYTVLYTRRADKSLEKIPHRERASIIRRTEALAENPRPSGARKLQGYENTYRLRVGDYRVIYEIRDDRLLVLVVEIGHRRKVYRKR